MSVRVALVLTIILGSIYAAAGLFDTLLHFTVGIVVACVGLIGYGLVDWIETR